MGGSFHLKNSAALMQAGSLPSPTPDVELVLFKAAFQSLAGAPPTLWTHILGSDPFQILTDHGAKRCVSLLGNLSEFFDKCIVQRERHIHITIVRENRITRN
jgi:hypothetical protein